MGPPPLAHDFQDSWTTALADPFRQAAGSVEYGQDICPVDEERFHAIGAGPIDARMFYRDDFIHVRRQGDLVVDTDEQDGQLHGTGHGHSFVDRTAAARAVTVIRIHEGTVIFVACRQSSTDRYGCITAQGTGRA